MKQMYIDEKVAREIVNRFKQRNPGIDVAVAMVRMWSKAEDELKEMQKIAFWALVSAVASCICMWIGILKGY